VSPLPWHGGAMRFRGPGIPQGVRCVTEGRALISARASRSRNLTPDERDRPALA
jgi:hypothetical protein